MAVLKHHEHPVFVVLSAEASIKEYEKYLDLGSQNVDTIKKLVEISFLSHICYWN